MAPVNYQQIFDDKWLMKARSKSNSGCWADAVVETLDTAGKIYLSTLRGWFNEFPATPNDKQKLCERLECFQDEQHLGGVNELTWWAFAMHSEIS
jgi:hypothetical protein